MFKYIFLFYIFVSTASLAQLPKQGLQLYNISAEQGLSNADVRHIFQDSRGYVWLGTGDGLSRYDGYACKSYKNDQNDPFSLQGSAVGFICEDNQKRLWIGVSRNVCIYNWDKDNFEKVTTFGNSYIVKVKKDSKQNLWALGMNKIALQKANSNTWQFFEKDFPEIFKDTSNIINNIVEGSQADEYWLTSRSNGIYKINLKTKQIKIFLNDPQNPNSLPSNITTGILKDQEGTLWVATRYGGVARLSLENEQFTNFNIESKEGSKTLVNAVIHIIEIGDYIFASTEYGGIAQIHKKTGQVTNIIINPDEPKGLTDNSIKQVYQDRQGRIWIGTATRGALVWDRFKEKFASASFPLLNQTVNSIWKDKKGRFWVGTEGGIAVKENGKMRYMVNEPQTPNSLRVNAVLSVYEDTKGQMWFGTWAGGISRYDEKANKFITYLHKDINLKENSSLNNVPSIREYSATNELLIGSSGGVIAVDTKQSPSFSQKDLEPARRLFEQSGEKTKFAKVLHEDKQQNLWIGSWRRLAKWNPKTQQITFYEENPKDANAISNINIHTIFEDSKNRIWVGTTNGLNLWKGEGQFKKYFVKNGLSDNYIYSITEDNGGNLWIGTGKGLTKFNPDKNTFKHYDNTDGLNNIQFRYNAVYKDPQNGQLFFGGVKGLDSFFPDSVKDNPHAPLIYLTDFKLFNKSVKVGDFDSLLTKTVTETSSITLTHTQSIFTIDYVALNLTQSHKNQYAYRLDGLESEWNYVGNQRSATYTNLDAGTYTFRVKASNNDGVWNEEGISLIINILPPWWETWWFRVLLVSLLGFSGYTFYQTRTRFLKKQNLKLEQQVLDRTKDLRLASEQIKTKNEELQASEEELRQNMEELEANQEELRAQKEQLEVTFQELSKQNTKVNDSIRYAQRIQQAILPHEEILKLAFSDHFVIYKPKDVVSGDFYWYFETNTESGIRNLESEKQNKEPFNNLTIQQSNHSTIQQPNYSTIQSKKKFLAVVDCTGHGVPGAFMSMIGNTLLREIVESKGIQQPANILTELNKSIISALNRRDKSFQDGMDIVLCCFENISESQTKLTYAGAKRPLYYFDNELHELKYNHTSIGHKADTQYHQEEVLLQPNTTLFLTTDGWIDIINHERNRFGSSRLKEMFKKAAFLRMDAQKEVFLKELEMYQQTSEQRDDILMVGVRV